jgi:hypothetical protein
MEIRFPGRSEEVCADENGQKHQHSPMGRQRSTHFNQQKIQSTEKIPYEQNNYSKE